MTTPSPESWAGAPASSPDTTTDVQPEQTAPAAAATPTPAAPATLVAPGSSGPAVAELAQLLEQLGFETYLSRGDNHDHVLTDDLLRQVRQVVSAHVKQTADPAELEIALREAALLSLIDGQVWQLLREKAAAAAAETASGTTPA